MATAVATIVAAAGFGTAPTEMRLLTDIGDSIADSADFVCCDRSRSWRKRSPGQGRRTGAQTSIEESQTGTNYNCALTLSQKPSRVKSSFVLERFDAPGYEPARPLSNLGICIAMSYKEGVL